jgi:methionyl-tRNA synthetase
MNAFNTKTFLTTTLPYVNSNPHIGHAFEFILADSISRFLKTKTNVHFNIGLDEHGLKVWSKAQELGISPENHIKNLTEVWLQFCQKFEINYDSFYKTSDKSHHEKVKLIWNRFQERGDIYKKSYSGNYCLGCESFKLEKELVDGKCTDHPTTELKSVEEENYFFKLTKYKDSLLSWLDSNPDFLQPKSKIEELRNLIIGSEDISISRLKENCPWGVEVPNDNTQVIYVWFDALLNYIFAAGYLTDEFNWDNVIQLCGPDNLRFQGVIFQAFLQSEGIKETGKPLVHGTILDRDGRKISKTLGNTIDPIDQLEKYGLDAVKYYALCGLSTYHNSSWNEEDLIRLHNSDLCNDWGNLVARTLHLIDIKSVNTEYQYRRNVDEIEFRKNIDNLVIEVEDLWSEFRVKEALQKTNEIVKLGNKYINDEKPWSNENYEVVLSNLYYLVKQVNELYLPVFPGAYSKVNIAINERKKVILFNKITQV